MTVALQIYQWNACLITYIVNFIRHFYFKWMIKVSLRNNHVMLRLTNEKIVSILLAKFTNSIMYLLAIK